MCHTQAVITVHQLAQFAPLCDAETLAPALSDAASVSGIDTIRRVANWLGQLYVESGGLTKFEENLNYSAERLCQVWPSRFPTPESATPFAHNLQGLANKVYGGRMGNIYQNDGWAYRGRGLIQITGRDNYHRYGVRLDMDLINNPSLAALPVNAAKIAADYWSAHGLNALADVDDIGGITRAINGGVGGLEDRRRAVVRAKNILGLQQA